MTIRNKNILIFCLMILLAIGIYIWFYPLNKGSLSVTANVVGYQIISDENVLDCPQNPCALSLKTGIHSIEIRKSGYLSENLNIQILRGRTTDAPIDLIKIPSLNLSGIAPEEKNNPKKSIPGVLNELSIVSPKWNSDESSLAYVDMEEERLKIWSNDNNISIITPLKNISKYFELYWSPDNQYLFGKEGQDLYFINVSKASRKKIEVAFPPKNFIWLQKSDSLLLNDDLNDLYIANLSDITLKPLSVTFDLKNAVFDKEGNLISYVNDSKENKVTIESFNPQTNEKKVIMTKYDFVINKIVADTNKNIFFYNTKDEKWYNLDY